MKSFKGKKVVLSTVVQLETAPIMGVGTLKFKAQLNHDFSRLIIINDLNGNLLNQLLKVEAFDADNNPDGKAAREALARVELEWDHSELVPGDILTLSIDVDGQTHILSGPDKLVLASNRSYIQRHVLPSL